MRLRHHQQGLDLTAVWHHSRLQWTNAHLRWPLARWRSVLFTECTDTMPRSRGPLSCPSSTAITSCFSMTMHSPMSEGSVHNSWKLKKPDISPTEHVWDALDRRVRQRVPVPANIQQLRTVNEEEWDNIPQTWKEVWHCMVVTQILTGFMIYAHTFFF